MKSKILVVAVHPDDETLGCGGTILRHLAEGDEVYWLTMTSMSESVGFSKNAINKKERRVKTGSPKLWFYKNNSFKFCNNQIRRVHKNRTYIKYIFCV